MTLSRLRRLRAAAVAAAFCAAAAPLDAAAAEALTPADVARLKVVSSVAIAPGGGQVAYTLLVPREVGAKDNGPPWTELHVADAEGGSRAFVTGKVNVSAVEWTGDGRHIAFLAKRGDDKHAALWLIPVDGGEARKVFSHATSIKSYSFAQDGRRVAFLAEDEQPEAEKKLEEKGFDAEVYEEEDRFTRVWIGTLDLGDDAGNAKAEPRVLELEGQASELHWSPAGDQLAVALAPSPRIDDHYMFRRLAIVDAGSGAILARVQNPGKLGEARWSPDGARLAFLSAADLNDPQEGRLMVADPTSGAFTDVLPDFAGHVTALEWSDAGTLVFLADQGTTSTIGEIGADGGGREEWVAAGAHVLTALSLAENGRAALVGQSAVHPGEVFVLDPGGDPRRLTDSNPWLAERRFAEQQVVQWQARDGLDLEGILVRPLDEQRGTRYPLIVSVHGGPEAHVSNGFVTGYSLPGHVAAARGFAVFYPNYRGSTGRGVEFSKAGQADYAGKEFDDIVDGVDHLIASGLADAKKVGITGGSYGGFATAWCSTKHSERFAAGVMFVGISDHVSKSGTTDIPEEMYLVHSRKRLWDDWEYFLERSPIRWVEQARTPLLILHGKEDPRVHPSQSLELYRQLKVLGQTPVRLIFYPGEGHGNRKAASRFDYHLRMMQWFEHYLQGPGGEPPPPELDYGLEKSQDAAQPADPEAAG